MQQLHLVGFTTDLDGLIFSTRKGAKSGSYVVPIDARLFETLAEARRLRADAGAADPADEEAWAQVDEGRPRRARAESALSPREIQTRLRAGRTVEEVAAEAGVDAAWVDRFASPIVAEQARVVAQARRLVYAKPRLGPSSQPLGEAVVWNLAEKGAFTPPDVLDANWAARHVHGSTWVVSLRYASRGRPHEASWQLDSQTGDLVALDRNASALGYVAPGRRRPAAARRAGLVTLDGSEGARAPSGGRGRARRAASRTGQRASAPSSTGTAKSGAPGGPPAARGARAAKATATKAPTKAAATKTTATRGAAGGAAAGATRREGAKRASSAATPRATRGRPAGGSANGGASGRSSQPRTGGPPGPAGPVAFGIPPSQRAAPPVVATPPLAPRRVTSPAADPRRVRPEAAAPRGTATEPSVGGPVPSVRPPASPPRGGLGASPASVRAAGPVASDVPVAVRPRLAERGPGAGEPDQAVARPRPPERAGRGGEAGVRTVSGGRATASLFDWEAAGDDRTRAGAAATAAGRAGRGRTDSGTAPNGTPERPAARPTADRRRGGRGRGRAASSPSPSQAPEGGQGPGRQAETAASPPRRPVTGPPPDAAAQPARGGRAAQGEGGRQRPLVAPSRRTAAASEPDAVGRREPEGGDGPPRGLVIREAARAGGSTAPRAGAAAGSGPAPGGTGRDGEARLKFPLPSQPSGPGRPGEVGAGGPARRQRPLRAR